MIDLNPARVGVDNPQRRRTEKRPFESWTELNSVVTILGPIYGPMVVFAAATGLRPGEWLALEWGDIDREPRVVYVRRALRNGRIKYPKTEASIRAVPLQALALSALDQRPEQPGGPLVFPSPSGGYFDLHNFRTATGSRPNSRLGSSRSDVSTISAIPSRPSLFVPASPPSTSIWVPA